jgi:hypothetical protein
MPPISPSKRIRSDLTSLGNFHPKRRCPSRVQCRVRLHPRPELQPKFDCLRAERQSAAIRSADSTTTFREEQAQLHAVRANSLLLIWIRLGPDTP